ncbi:MAG: DegT/DnrJ/EryC1/StrS family aminotransferase [Kiloniellales bacterium]
MSSDPNIPTSLGRLRARIPVMRPRMADASALLPYLRRIDEARWYSNFGPLAREFEARIAARYGLSEGSAAALANGTLGLTLALKALEPAPGALCLIPAFTFTASACAVAAAGLTPYFVDVDPASWALEPAGAEAALAAAPGLVAAVMPVSVFGRPVEAAAWDAFTARTGISAVIDGAASFDGAKPARSPTMVSLHGTKILGTGEGGLILSSDRELIARVRSLSSFGFRLGANLAPLERAAALPGINAKFSEHAAALGLAALDLWEDSRGAFATVYAAYRKAFAGLPGIAAQPGGWDGWVAATVSFALQRPGASALIEALASAGVESRSWWGAGCHRDPVFAACPRADLSVSEELVERVIGLPCHPDLTAAEIAEIATLVAGHLGSGSTTWRAAR